MHHWDEFLLECGLAFLNRWINLIEQPSILSDQMLQHINIMISIVNGTLNFLLRYLVARSALSQVGTVIDMNGGSRSSIRRG
jgi:hypothetical protein